MASIIEKPNGTLVLLVHLSLKPGRDDVLIRLLRSAPKGALAGVVREAMRTGIGEDPGRELEDGDQIFELPDIGTDL